MTKFVYLFKEGNATMRNTLGGKGANLAEMTNLGLPVPQGFTVTTEACNKYYEDNETISEEVKQQVYQAVEDLEKITERTFGDPKNPLLVSVRSGARASMPGMMDTVLNLGLNDEVVEGLAELTGNRRFALDSYRRFIMMFSDVVMEIHSDFFEAELEDVKRNCGVKLDSDLDADGMAEVVTRFKKIYAEKHGDSFPTDPMQQLMAAITAVFRSWNNDRAIYYRRMNDIPASWGTAVNVQQMVYGNMGEDSGTGVAFTRNPSTGENKFYGEYLINAQGEDVVAGIRTPSQISHLEDQMPEVFHQFHDIAMKLEKHYGDMQDMEFTIERGKLFMLQTRNGKRTAPAALKIAVDMVEEGLVSKERALKQIDPAQLDALLHPTFDEAALKAEHPIAKGLPASPGAAAGKIVFTADEAQAQAQAGAEVILVRNETSPEDIQGMNAAQGILTVRGGMTSHAAVVARGMGKCCVSGCAEISIDAEAKLMTVGGKQYHEGDLISLNGSTGYIYAGAIKTVEASMSDDFRKVMQWTDEIRVLEVRTNADTPHDAEIAKTLGAQGIGLVRTEHMFFDPERIFAFRQMIVAKDVKARERALERILPMQKEDFVGIFKAMKGMPVTIRLLDPPLHEFLPTSDHEVQELAQELGITVEELRFKIMELHEINPMLGHRGCRLAVTYPEIAVMQTRAIIGAAIEASDEEYQVVPEIMVPLVCDVKELAYLRQVISEAADALIEESGVELTYHIGTMIEIPRAALTADKIAEKADFFSFGTNDLTQMSFGLSRDDAGGILENYYQKGIFENDPTARLDTEGVGQLMRIAAEKARPVNPDIHLGICGEHGGDPSSIRFCHSLGFDYVSCSPYRVPIAKLAAAQAQIDNPRQ